MKTENWINVFNSAKLNRKLEEDGVAKFSLGPDFKTASCVNILKQNVPGYPEEFEDKFFSSVSIASSEVKRKVDFELSRIICPILDKLLSQHKVLKFFFLVKGCGSSSELKLHQDWTILDERKFRAYSLWIPLSATNAANGTVHVLKGSQNFPLNIRGAGIPPKYNNHFEKISGLMEAINVEPGGALIFDSRLLHYSPANTTGRSRTAIISNIVPVRSSTKIFYGQSENGVFNISEEMVSEDFFFHYENFAQQKDHPDLQTKKLATIDYGNTESVDSREFMSLVGRYVKKKKWYLFS